MGLRFSKRVRIFPGVRLNFSTKGISTTIGVRGASVNFGRRGSFLNLGLPGSGISYRTQISKSEKAFRNIETSPLDDLPSARAQAIAYEEQAGRTLKIPSVVVVAVALPILLILAKSYSELRTQGAANTQIKTTTTPPNAANTVPPPLPAKFATDQAEPPKQTSTFYVQRQNVNVRDLPSTSAPVSVKLSKGMKVSAFKKEGEWIQVGDDIPRGWVHSTLLGVDNPKR